MASFETDWPASEPEDGVGDRSGAWERPRTPRGEEGLQFSIGEKDGLGMEKIRRRGLHFGISMLQYAYKGTRFEQNAQKYQEVVYG